ncbi:hypothetical protein GUG94_15680, partial [Xanthomonas citri pv. citri]|nr:hypothetical protein [Xanthomonas citri pv. citri]
GPSSQGWRISEVQDAKAKVNAETSNGEADETVICHVAADGFEERMVPFPVPSGSYRDLAVVKDGVVWIEVADRGGE